MTPEKEFQLNELVEQTRQEFDHEIIVFHGGDIREYMLSEKKFKPFFSGLTGEEISDFFSTDFDVDIDLESLREAYHHYDDENPKINFAYEIENELLKPFKIKIDSLAKSFNPSIKAADIDDLSNKYKYYLAIFNDDEMLGEDLVDLIDVFRGYVPD